jgi:predicted nucleic acid-binding protein
MIVLDTNVVSEVLKRLPAPQVVDWMTDLDGDVAITSITLAELWAGVRRLPEGRRKNALGAAVDRTLAPYRGTGAILAFEERAAEQYAEVLKLREDAGLPVSTADAQIAAICRVHGATCATRNTKDFAGTGVGLVNPWES